ncbi:MAG: peptidoglycan recognition family protein [Elusimicrobiota bacterium]|jgi:hypothetical protein
MKNIFFCAALSVLTFIGGVARCAEREGVEFTFSGETVLRLPQEDAGILKAGELQLAADPAKEDFISVIFHGRSEGPFGVDAAVESGGALGEWVAADVERLDSGRFWGVAVISGKAGDRLHLRVSRAQEAKTGELTFLEIESVPPKNAASRTRRIFRGRAMKVSFSPPPAGPSPEPFVLEFISRSLWGARSPSEPYEPMLPELISIHHTAGEQPMGVQDAQDEMALMQRYHQKGRGWNDIGYHFILDGAGRVYRGRPVNVVGAHVRDNNEGNIGISLMGNFQQKRGKPTEQQLGALITLVRWLAREYGVPPAGIFAHRDEDPDTVCPGAALYKLMPAIRKAAFESEPPADSTSAKLRAVHLPQAAAFDFAQAWR